MEILRWCEIQISGSPRCVPGGRGPARNEQKKINEALCRTRVLIEQTYGISKQQIQCLHHDLHCSPEQAVDYITACSILHNIGINRSDIFINNNSLDLDVVQCINSEIPVPQNIDGYRKRNAIAHIFSP